MACRGSGVRVPSDPPERRGSPAGRASSRFCLCALASAGRRCAALIEVPHSGAARGVRAQEASSRRGAGVGGRESWVLRSSRCRVLGAARGRGPRKGRLGVVRVWVRASRWRCAHRGVAFWALRGGGGPGRVVSAWCGCGCARDAGAALIDVACSGCCAGVGARNASSRRGPGHERPGAARRPFSTSEPHGDPARDVGCVRGSWISAMSAACRSSRCRVLGAARGWGPRKGRLGVVRVLGARAARVLRSSRCRVLGAVRGGGPRTGRLGVARPGAARSRAPPSRHGAGDAVRAPQGRWGRAVHRLHAAARRGRHQA